SCRRITDVSSPRRRCVAATLTIVTPAAGTDAPPGTVSRNENAPAVPTHVSPSHTPTERPNSVSERHSSRSSSASGTPLKARTRVPYHRSHSSCRSTRGALTVPAVLVRSLAIRHAYQCDRGGARQFFSLAATRRRPVKFTVKSVPATGDNQDLPCQAAGPMDRVPN